MNHVLHQMIMSIPSLEKNLQCEEWWGLLGSMLASYVIDYFGYNDLSFACNYMLTTMQTFITGGLEPPSR
jgi:hypothetical protein